MNDKLSRSRVMVNGGFEVELEVTKEPNIDHEQSNQNGNPSTIIKRGPVYPNFGSMFIRPLELGLPIYVLSKISCTHPLSFSYMYTQKPFKDLIAPLHMGMDRVRKQPPTKRAEVFRDFETQENGELKLVNKTVLDAQSGIFGEVVKRAMASIFSGQGLVGMSMPVKIFEPRSTLQRIADSVCYVTSILKRADFEKNPIERAKYCLACVVSGICMSPGQMKPFNPLLGETYEAAYPDGSQFYMEHTSHHPPISNFLIKTTYGVTIDGRFEQVADMGANSMEIIYRGPFNIQFSDGSRVTMFFPTGIQSGVIVGNRLLKFSKKVCFIDVANMIKGYIEMGKSPEKGRFKSKRVDVFSGEVYYYDLSKHKGYGENYKEVGNAFKGKDKTRMISVAQGSIFECLEFDEVQYWNFDSAEVVRAEPIQNPIPSDYRFREDLLWLEYGDKEQSQKWKYKLEEIQRWDRSLRQESEKQRKKGKK